MEKKYPKVYRHITLNWVDNKPKFKEGDKVIIFNVENGYSFITLKKSKKRAKRLIDIKACWPCRKPNPLTVNKYVYTWNDGEFTEGREIDTIKRLNELSEELKKANQEKEKFQRKADVYDTIKAAWEEDELEDY